MKTLRSALPALVLGLTLHAHHSNAALFLYNDTEEVAWYVGEPAPSISMPPDNFGVMACGEELAWVYANFPMLPTRKIGTEQPTRRAAAAVPSERECVIWRGDSARFIADNITVTVD